MRLSVIIPTYNRAIYLDEAIRSIAGQRTDYADAVDIEVVVIDDGSDDNTEEIAEGMTGLYPELNLRYIRKEHTGISASRNLGILSSKGEWIGFLDSDDRWHSDKIKKQISYLRNHPDCKIVFTRYRNFLDSSVKEVSKIQNNLMDEVDPTCLATALVHRSLFDKNGLFCERLACGEDSEWIQRNMLLSVDLNHYVEECLYDRRVHDSNISLHNRNNALLLNREILIMAMRMAHINRRKKTKDQIRTD